MSGLFADKVVVVAGHGPGLGAALATRSAEEGARVVVAARNAERLDAAAEKMRADGYDVVAVATDVADPEACERLRDRALEAYGRVDALFVNAFTMPPMKPLTTVRHDKIRAAMEVNVFGPLTLTTLFTDALAESGGSIVMVNSAVLYQTEPDHGAYKITKAALLHAAQALAAELGPRGIRVNSIAPNYIYEDKNKMYFDWLASERGVTHQDIYDELAARADLKRLATPEELADAALMLASPYARTVTGVCLDVTLGEFKR